MVGLCQRCSGTKKLLVGALLLLNAFVWPQWSGIDGWVAWLAVLMVIGGAVKLFVPNNCSSCHAGHMHSAAPAKKTPAKRKRRK